VESTPSTVYVLDSSFNPPTRAHLKIAASALQNDKGSTPKRLLLLLATQNADKAPKPASFEERLVLMSIFASDFISAFRASASNATETEPVVDLGVTKFPYFMDKAAAIQDEGPYGKDVEQVHLTGFDTLIRIFDSKYYPGQELKALEPFLKSHRLRVTYRLSDGWGDKEEQDEYLSKIARGEREDEGAKREWSSRIELVEGAEKVVSSTRVREACKTSDELVLKELVTDGVAEWVLSHGLYRDD
jgi:nicotinamide-nucleotide adenylyltransferase